MKTRVWKCGTHYYPQYKGWFFWHFIYMGRDNPESFAVKDKAIDFLHSKQWYKWEEVVWESGKEKA